MAKKAHAYTRVCSITMLVFYKHEVIDEGERPVSTARVWREKRDLGPWELEDTDLYDAIKDMHPGYIREIAQRLIDVKGVVKVEVIRESDGCGIMIEE